MKVSSLIGTLLSGATLGFAAARKLFKAMLTDSLSEVQTKAILLLLAKRGIAEEELEGFLSAYWTMEPPLGNRFQRLMDVCGTGGDGSGSINVSTIASFVIAGVGGQVAKHGNRSISSRCGSSDLIEALGGRLDVPAKTAMLSISQCGIGYFHAPFFHPLFAKYQALRRQIKIPTVFNLLGPLINPLRLRYQMIGVNSLRTMHLYANVLAKQKMQRAMVCHSRDGMDEISPFAVTDFAWVEHGRVKVGWIEPRSYGFRSKLSANALYGGDPVQNKNITTRLLQGKLAGPLRDIVLLNGGAGLWVCELAKNLKEGISMACDAIDSGKAYAALQQFIALSNESRNRKRP